MRVCMIALIMTTWFAAAAYAAAAAAAYDAYDAFAQDEDEFLNEKLVWNNRNGIRAERINGPMSRGKREGGLLVSTADIPPSIRSTDPRSGNIAEKKPKSPKSKTPKSPMSKNGGGKSMTMSGKSGKGGKSGHCGKKSKDKAYTQQCGSEVLSDFCTGLPKETQKETQEAIEKAGRIFGTVCNKSFFENNNDKEKKALFRAVAGIEDEVEFCVSFNGNDDYQLYSSADTKNRCTSEKGEDDPDCGNCAVAIGSVGGSTNFKAEAGSQGGADLSCNRALIQSEGEVEKKSYAKAGVGGGKCNLAISRNFADDAKYVRSLAGAGNSGGDKNVAVAINRARGGGVAQATAGEGNKSNRNQAAATNHAEAGEADAQAGGSRNSDENKASAINTGASNGGKTYVSAGTKNKNGYEAGLVNSGDACEQSDIPYNADNVYNPCER